MNLKFLAQDFPLCVTKFKSAGVRLKNLISQRLLNRLRDIPFPFQAPEILLISTLNPEADKLEAHLSLCWPSTHPVAKSLDRSRWTLFEYAATLPAMLPPPRRSFHPCDKRSQSNIQHIQHTHPAHPQQSSWLLRVASRATGVCAWNLRCTIDPETRVLPQFHANSLVRLFFGLRRRERRLHRCWRGIKSQAKQYAEQHSTLPGGSPHVPAVRLFETSGNLIGNQWHRGQPQLNL